MIDVHQKSNVERGPFPTARDATPPPTIHALSRSHLTPVVKQGKKGIEEQRDELSSWSERKEVEGRAIFGDGEEAC